MIFFSGGPALHLSNTLTWPICIEDFSESDEDYSESDEIVERSSKKAKKNSAESTFNDGADDDLSDDNSAIMTPVIKASNLTTMKPGVSIMVRRFWYI